MTRCSPHLPASLAARALSRRKLLGGAGTALAAAGLTAGLRYGGAAQEATNLNPGPATPNALGPAVPPELTRYANDWPAPQGNLAATRAAADSPINATNVDRLKVAWTLPITAAAPYGGMVANPLVAGDTTYVQDTESNISAIDRQSGRVKWQRHYGILSVGPNGLALGYGMVYGPLSSTAEVVALEAGSGRPVWRVRLSNSTEEGILMPPTVANNTVYISTEPTSESGFRGYAGGARGILFALDAKTGHTLWSFDTATDNLWGNPRLNSGPGLWEALSVDDDGNLYFGTGNAAPIPGVVAFGTPYPNGASRPGANDYASSMVSLDAKTGALRWSFNAKPHDLFDLDFQLTPIITTVDIAGTPTKVAIGGGKVGKVIAVEADSGRLLWETKVGKHQNDDLQAVPPGQRIQVFPGPLGGVETPMAYAEGLVFVPVVNLAGEFTSLQNFYQDIHLNQATGELLALDATTGAVKWDVQLPQMNVGAATVANDVVFTATLDGMIRAYETTTGRPLWSHQAGAGINAPMAVAGDMVIVPAAGPLFRPAAAAAGTPSTASTRLQLQLIAFKLAG